MRILIADDSPERYSKLVKDAEAEGISKSSFEFAISIRDIRAALNEAPPFDLMVLDLLLPNWPCDQDQSTQHTIDLLRELIENDEMHRPRNIIGITGDKSLHEEHYAEFASFAWTLLSYNASESEWADSLFASIKYISRLEENKNETSFDVDITIVCALLNPELNAILELPWNWEAPIPMDSSTFYRRGKFSIDGRERTVVAVFQPRMGMVAAATLTTKVISKFRPKVIIMPGICAGIEGEATIGDVIFAETAWNYQSGKISSNGGENIFEVDPDQISADPSATAAMKLLTQENTKLYGIADKYPNPDNSVPRLHVAPVASGSAVVANDEEVTKVRQANRKVKGLEMEIYGVYSAAKHSMEPKPRVFAIKAVCDLANSSKNDNHQKFAAYMSAKVLELAIEEHTEMLLGP